MLFCTVIHQQFQFPTFPKYRHTPQNVSPVNALWFWVSKIAERTCLSIHLFWSKFMWEFWWWDSHVTYTCCLLPLLADRPLYLFWLSVSVFCPGFGVQLNQRSWHKPYVIWTEIWICVYYAFSVLKNINARILVQILVFCDTTLICSWNVSSSSSGKVPEEEINLLFKRCVMVLCFLLSDDGRSAVSVTDVSDVSHDTLLVQNYILPYISVFCHNIRYFAVNRIMKYWQQWRT
jgi:hypothetical protein